MKSIKLFNVIAMLLMVSFFMTSCSKDDSVTTDVKEEQVESSATMQINNRSITSNAVALYCNDNGKENITLSNNPDLLGFPFNTEDFVENDFAFNFVDDPSVGSYAIGTAVFGEDVLGFEGLLITNSVGVEYEITSNDGSFITGTMGGEWLIIDTLGMPSIYPYTVEFNAEIIGVSTYCD